MSIDKIIIETLEKRVATLTAAARELVRQVDNYTVRAGSRTLLLNAKRRLEEVLDG